MELSSDRIEQEREEVEILLFAGGDGGPHALVVVPARFAASALGNSPVDHAVAELLLVVIVRLLDPLDKHKAKIVLRQIILARLRGLLVHVRDDRARAKLGQVAS